MLPIASWRVFYADGSTFDSSQGSWADAPPFGTVCVVYYHVGDKVRRTLDVQAHDTSVYVYQGEGDMADVKLGLWMDADGFYRILDAAGRSLP